MRDLQQVQDQRQEERQTIAAFREWWEEDAGDCNVLVPRSVRLFFKRLGIEEVHEALQISLRFAEGHEPMPRTDLWKYFCGVCWKKIRALEATENEDTYRPG